MLGTFSLLNFRLLVFLLAAVEELDRRNEDEVQHDEGEVEVDHGAYEGRLFEYAESLESMLILLREKAHLYKSKLSEAETAEQGPK